jgi:hypothetical protein
VKQLFSKDSRYLPLILKLNLAFLIGCIVLLALFFPLSGSGKGFFVLVMAVLAGVNWSLLDHVRK